ncbi:MAG TPA: S41 family peptidase [Chloroflexota bacterium]|nr:S41 family peptidase [Chloroflexota bacterium]
MKVARAIAPLLLLSLSACAGPSLPGRSQASSSSASAAAANLSTVQKAYQDLLDNYVDQPDPGLLLTGALQNVQQTLASQGVNSATVQVPAWGKDANADWSQFSGIFGPLDSRYGAQLGAGTLQNAAMTGMANSLNDCLTHYYDPASLTQRQAELNGQQNFAGIGVLMKNIPGHPTVLRILDGPAKSSGLQPGDEIVAVDGKSTQGQAFEDVRNSIRGPAGQAVTLTVKRPGSNGTQDFTIQRAQIQAPIVEAAILGGTIGYMHIYSFPQGVQTQIANALQTFDQRGATSVIIDVRTNTGGDHQTILSTLSLFIKGGQVESEILRNGQAQSFSVDGTSFWKNPKPLVVLADDDTQSGGELFAKAMQEEGGYKVVGTKTSGCTASAKLFDLGNGAGIEISTGKIVSGKGTDINRAGVTPDVAQSLPVEDLAAGRDPQLTAAVQVLQGQATSGTASVRPSGQPPASSAAAASQPASGGSTTGGGAPTIIKPLIKPDGSAVFK